MSKLSVAFIQPPILVVSPVSKRQSVAAAAVVDFVFLGSQP